METMTSRGERVGVRGKHGIVATLELAMTDSKANRLTGMTYPTGTAVAYARDGFRR
jgi:hypothetical protein